MRILEGIANGPTMDGLADLIVIQTGQLQFLSLALCAAIPWDLGADGKAGACFLSAQVWNHPHFTDGKIVLPIWKEPAAGCSFPHLESAYLMSQPHSPMRWEGRQLFCLVGSLLRQE